MNNYDIESYAHHHSKEIVEQWIRTKWSKMRELHHETITFGPLSWKINCMFGPGVKQEYPILKAKSGNLIGFGAEWTTYPDLDKDKLAERGQKVEMVLDLVISEEGKPKYGIEIVHTHACSKHKREAIKKLRPDFKVYELSANWVMSQLYGRIPTSVPLVEIIN